jgi:hypothetical protein
MGKGHAVASAYIWIREGAPQPITAMKVGTGSWRRASGVIEAERARRYCWQFWEELVVHRTDMGRGTYAAVEVSHEYQEHTARDVGTGV